MTRDLTWTGNHFLDPAAHTARLLQAAEDIDITNKDEVWSRRVAEAAAAHFGVPADFVRVGAGATQLIDTLLRSAYRGLVVDVTPNFHLTATVARQQGWEYLAVPVREPGELLPALEPHLGRDDAITVLCSPRNPLGYQFPVRDVAALVERARGLVVLDEVYADFAPATALPLVERFPNLVVMRTFSKAWGLANLRIGFAVSASFAREDFPFWLMPNSVSGVAQRTALSLLADPAPVRDSVRRMHACRERLVAGLSGVEGLRLWPSDANYVCLETPRAAEVVEELGHAGYRTRLVHDLRGYPADWPAGVRIVVPPEPDVDRVVKGVLHAHQGPGAAPAPADR
ncbi:pyridoxal phosphate-dependent aminotransferase [Streptomyces kanasensis]|uniref:pyridoxal phosphate-dependent aminotransferase n=1 Tax=Streptomyces kanasensis TaxID=936756 RepID=UPI0037FD5358